MDVVKSRKNLSGGRTQFSQLSSPQPTHATEWKCLFHVGTGCFLVLSATAELLIYFDTIEDTDTALSMPRAIIVGKANWEYRYKTRQRHKRLQNCAVPPKTTDKL
jgi:hypothetical protein